MSASGDYIDLPPPIKGVDQSLPQRAQADLTCPDARNVRSFPASAQAQTVGGRDGHGKAFTNPAGGGAVVPISGLEVAVRAFNTSPTTVGTYSFVNEAWADYSFPATYQGYQIGYELRGRYFRSSRKSADYGATGWQGTTVPPGKAMCLVRGNGLPNHMAFVTNFSDSYNQILSVTEDTSNDVSMTLNCYRWSKAIDFVDCHNIGPFVRGHPDLGAFVWAYLQRQGDNSVKLVIESVYGNTSTQLAAGDVTSLSGSNTISNNCRIQLQATSAGLTATWDWPDESISQTVGVSSTAGVKTQQVHYDTFVSAFVKGEEIYQSTTGATGIVIEDVYDTGSGQGVLAMWVTSGTFTAAGAYTLKRGGSGGTTVATTMTAIACTSRDNARGGVYFKNPATSYPGSEPGYFRRVSSLTFSKLVPPNPEVIVELYGTSTYSGAARYLLPPNWEAYDIDTAQGASAVLRIQAGQTGYSSATAQRCPLVDQTEQVIYGPNIDARLTQSGIVTIEVWGSTPPTEHYDIEVKMRDVDGTVDDGIGAVFCMENMT